MAASGTAALKEAATGVAPAGSIDTPQKFTSFLERFKPQMALALPKHLNADRMCRLAVTSFSKSAKLQQCDPKSIVASILTAAQLGLEIDVQGQGYLVPYKGRAQFIPGWKGLVDICNRSGRATVWTGVVFSGDEFDYALGDSPFVRHRPGMEDDVANITHVYAIGRVNNSQWPVIEVWSIAKIWKHRNRYNKVGTDHYSYANPEMYARKIPLLQVLKYMPASIELTNAIEVANAAETGNSTTIDGDFLTTEADAEPEKTPMNVDKTTGEISTDTKAAEVKPADPNPAEAKAGDSKAPELTFEVLLKSLQKRTDIDILDADASLIGEIGDFDQRNRLTKAYQERRAELTEPKGKGA